MRTSVLGKVHFMPSKYDPESRATLSVWCWISPRRLRALFDTTELNIAPGSRLVELVEERITAFAAKYTS
jgi:hypothetical protein